MKAIEDQVNVAAEARYTKEDFELYKGYADNPDEVIHDKKEVGGRLYRAYTVQQNDTLGSISEEILGSIQADSRL